MNINYHNLWYCSIGMASGAGSIGLSSMIANRLLQTSDSKTFAISLLIRNSFTGWAMHMAMGVAVYAITAFFFNRLGMLHYRIEKDIVGATAGFIYISSVDLASQGNQAAAYLVTTVAVATVALGLLWGTNYLIRHTVGVYNAIVHPRIPAPP